MINTVRSRISVLGVFGVVVICSLFALAFAPSARADTTYTYTGLPFTDVFGVDSCINGVGECSLSGTITLASPLAPLSSPLVTPLSFSFTDGVHTLDNTNSIAEPFSFVTGSDGQILGWLFGMKSLGGPPTTILGSATFLQPNEFTDNATYTFVAVAQGETVIGGGVVYAHVLGTWTRVPEPSSLILLGTGLLGMAGAWRWRRAA